VLTILKPLSAGGAYHAEEFRNACENYQKAHELRVLNRDSPIHRACSGGVWVLPDPAFRTPP
jgi:hypothetical protein